MSRDLRQAWDVPTRRTLVLVAILAAVLLPGCAERGSPTGDADARIAYYRARLGGPGTYPAYARLGVAFLQKMQETGETRYLVDAEEYLQASLRMQRNFEALCWLAATQLAGHKFHEARDHAREAVRAMPDDIHALGVLFDAELACGDLEAAEAIANRMMTIEKGSASLLREATLREARGDLGGTVEALKLACESVESEKLPASTRAWCRVRLGTAHLALCDLRSADAAYRRALTILPGYYLADEHLAELRAAEDRRDEAMEIYRRLIRRTGRPLYRVALADLHDLEGQVEESGRERALALADLRASVDSGSRADWSTFAMLLLETEGRTAEGVQWAEKDHASRGDSHAADTLAWSYYRAGRLADAERIMDGLLSEPRVEPLVLYHAAAIFNACGRHDEARDLLREALNCPAAFAPRDREDAERLHAEIGRS